jgi:hypothetical protein
VTATSRTSTVKPELGPVTRAYVCVCVCVCVGSHIHPVHGLGVYFLRVLDFLLYCRLNGVLLLPYKVLLRYGDTRSQGPPFQLSVNPRIFIGPLLS